MSAETRQESFCFPDGLDARGFLATYWQKRPLLMRRAAQGVLDEVDVNDIAGLACEPDCEARLVEIHGGKTRLEHGPFRHQRLSALADRDWTLLVQDVDKYVPAVAALRTLVRFVPAWRFEDIMISIAAPGGGVGAHIDAYDVFLLQASGNRRWRIGEQGANPSCDDSGELAILTDFAPVASWDLAPGDVLYLPPGVPHEGTALDLCMTVSIGFRAPARADLLSAALEQVLTTLPDDASDSERYADPDLVPAEAGTARLDAAAVERARRLLGGLRLDTRDAAVFSLGVLGTETKLWLRPPARSNALDCGEIERRCDAGATLQWHPWCRFLCAKSDTSVWFFVDGEPFRLPVAEFRAVDTLCSGKPSIRPGGLHGPLGEVVTRLVNEGRLLIE